MYMESDIYEKFCLINRIESRTKFINENEIYDREKYTISINIFL